MNKAFRFVGSFKLVVMARNLTNARKYVKNQAISSVSHRSLKYVGEGHPTNGDGWVGAVADRPDVPDWIRAPVVIPAHLLDANGCIA